MIRERASARLRADPCETFLTAGGYSARIRNSLADLVPVQYPLLKEDGTRCGKLLVLPAWRGLKGLNGDWRRMSPGFGACSGGEENRRPRRGLRSCRKSCALRAPSCSSPPAGREDRGEGRTCSPEMRHFHPPRVAAPPCASGGRRPRSDDPTRAPRKPKRRRCRRDQQEGSRGRHLGDRYAAADRYRKRCTGPVGDA